MDTAALSLYGQRDLQAYQLSGRIQMESYQYAKVSRSNENGATDILELGSSQKLSIEFTMSMVQERSQSKLEARFPDAPGGLNLDSSLDTSPEATSDRIVQFATNFLGAYMDQHPEMDDKEALDSFMSLIRDAIDEGFAQAKDIIESVNSMTPELGSTIQSTYDLVQQKLDDFYSQLLEQIQAGQEDAQDTDVVAA